jgi:putative two-component system response regulator
MNKRLELNEVACVTNHSRAKLERAQQVISQALKSGLCSNELELEVIATELATMREDTPEQMDLMLDVVRYFYIAGKPSRGLEIAEQTRKFAVRTAHSYQATVALTLVGVCSADTGNLPKAMEAYADALSLAQKNQDKLQEAKIWQNLAVALSYSGLHEESIKCSLQAVTLANRLENVGGIMQMLHMNMAACHLHLDEIRLGLSANEKSIALSKAPEGPHDLLNRVLAENCFTRLCIENGDFEGAHKHAAATRRFASQSKSPRADISASVAEGIAEVFSGQSNAGIARLTGALERGTDLKITIREVLAALVKAHEHLGQHDKALKYLNIMLEQQRKTQQANVLHHVKYHLEQLHSSDGSSAIEDGTQFAKMLETRAEVFEGRIAKNKLKEMERERFVARVDVLERMAVMAELRDDASGEHSYRVGRLASLLAREVGCDEDMIFMIDIAARLNDIGKVGIPDSILLKPGKLNEGEREIMSAHALIGAELLAKSQIPQIQMAEEIARHHHEWWDGNGYPDKLAGTNIPIAARITALADVFDALTHERAYRPARTIDEALQEILRLKGRQFEPDLANAFIAMVNKLRMHYSDLDRYLGGAARSSPLLLARAKIREAMQAVKGQT